MVTSSPWLAEGRMLRALYFLYFFALCASFFNRCFTCANSLSSVFIRDADAEADADANADADAAANAPCPDEEPAKYGVGRGCATDGAAAVAATRGTACGLYGVCVDWPEGPYDPKMVSNRGDCMHEPSAWLFRRRGLADCDHTHVRTVGVLCYSMVHIFFVVPGPLRRGRHPGASPWRGGRVAAAFW